MKLVADRKIRSPLKAFGGKSYLARRIIALMPDHGRYVEPFVFGGSVFLNKRPAFQSAIGDLNPMVADFWRSLRSSRALVEWIEMAEYSEETFARVKSGLRSSERAIRAWAFLVRNRMSRGGLGETFAWSDRLRGGQPGDVNAWETMKTQLPEVLAKLDSTLIMNAPAVRTIRSMDGPETLFYCDPPYLHETRTARQAYGDFEMDAEAHAELLDVLSKIEGKFLLSGYRSAMYDDAAARHGWSRVDFEIANHSGQGKSKQRRTECVWANFELPGSEGRD